MPVFASAQFPETIFPQFDTRGRLGETRDSCSFGGLRWKGGVPKWRNWQTRVVQVHVLARVWGFESLLRHQLSANFPIKPVCPNGQMRSNRSVEVTNPDFYLTLGGT